VANGIVDMASDTINLDKDPAGGVLSLPMLVTTEHEWQAAMKAIEPYLKEGFTEQGLIYLGMYRYPAQTIFASFELNSATDLHGKKMRVTAPIQTALIEHFGGTAVTLDGVEVPQALQHGIVDGVLTASGGGAKKWHTFLKTNYRLSINYGCSVLIANRNSFERLPPEHQQALIKTFAEAGSKITKDFMADEKAQVEGQSSYGIKIIKADPADVASAQKAMEKVWAQWAEEKGPRAVKALAAVRVAIGK
jgi:TRAP-type C4-dicarboxylate transport system substrate-binding protein